MKQLNLLIISCLIFSLSISCTRSTDTSLIEINLSSGSEGAQSLILRGIIINITAPDMPPIYYSSFNEQSGISNSVIIEVPAGSNRLFQVLAIVYKSTADQEVFQYAEATKNLSTSSDTLPLSLNQIGGANTREARIGGRYETFDGTTVLRPTGNILVRFHPNATSPAMLLKKDLIINGWFQTFGIVDPAARFSYVVEETGQVLFDRVSFDDTSLSAPFNANSDWNLKLSVPRHYIFRGPNSQPPYFRSNPEMDIYLGHYRYNTTTNSYVNASVGAVVPTPGAFINIFSTNTVNPGPPVVPNGAPITYNPAADSDPTTIDKKLGTGGSSCATPFGAQICIRSDLFDSDAYSAFGFDAPFEYLSNPDGFDTIGVSSAKNFTRLRWKYLPNIDVGIYGVKGFDVFAKKNFDGEQNDKEYDCKLLGSEGYSVVASADFTTHPTNVTSLQSLNVYGADDKDHLLVCPYYIIGTQKTYFSSPQDVYNKPYQDINQFVEIDHVLSPGKRNALVNTCEQWRAKLVNKYGDTISFPSPQILRLVAYDNSSSITYFKDANCTQSITTIPLAANQSQATFYVMSDVSSPSSYSSSNSYLYGYMTNGTPGIKREITFSFSAPATNTASFPPALNISPERCYPIDMRFMSAGAPARPASNQIVTLSTDNTNARFYSNPNCQGTPINSLTVTTDQTYGRAYYKSTTTPGSEIITLTGPNGPINITINKISNNAVDDTAYAFMPLSHRYEYGDCMPYFISASEESIYYTSTFALVGGLNRTLTAGDALEGNDPTCTSPTPVPFPNMNIGPFQNRTQIKYLKHSTSSSTIAFQINGASNGSTTMSMMPPSVLQLDVDTNLDTTVDYIAINGTLDNPITQTTCIGLYAKIFNSNGIPYTYSSTPITVDFSVTSGAGNFYTDNACSVGATTNTSAAIPANISTSAVVYFRANASQTGTINIKSVAAGFGKSYNRARIQTP